MPAEQERPRLPKPRREHNLLEPFAGTFRAKVRIYAGPDRVHDATGEMVSTWQLGGLYLHQVYAGDKGEGPFPQFLGQGYWGYNFSLQKYEGFWIDNASSMMQLERGDADAEGKVFTMVSVFTHPQTGELMQKKSVLTLIDFDHHRMDSYMTCPDGSEVKAMEIEYARA